MENTQQSSPLTAFIRYVRQDLWSPYAAGALLGLVAVFTLWMTTARDSTVPHMPGASGSFQNIAAYAGEEVTGETREVGDQKLEVGKKGLEGQYNYFARVMPKGITWQVYLLIGIFLGSFVSASLSRGFQFTQLPHSEQWVQVFGDSVAKRWIMVFFGGIILQVAAGIAGGCTSGLAISGGVQLTPAAFLFIPGLFLSGTITAWVLYGRKF